MLALHCIRPRRCGVGIHYGSDIWLAGMASEDGNVARTSAFCFAYRMFLVYEDFHPWIALRALEDLQTIGRSLRTSSKALRADLDPDSILLRDTLSLDGDDEVCFRAELLRSTKRRDRDTANE